MKSKFLGIIILAVVLCLLLASCQTSDGGTADGTTSDGGTDVTTSASVGENSSSSGGTAGTPQEEKELVLYENGVFNFQLTRSDDLKDLTVFTSFLSNSIRHLSKSLTLTYLNLTFLSIP